MFAKLSADGRDIHPLYQYLTDRQTNPKFSGPITWNFNKFLIDRTGQPIARFDSVGSSGERQGGSGDRECAQIGFRLMLNRKNSIYHCWSWP
jgi:hypothetical protein